MSNTEGPWDFTSVNDSTVVIHVWMLPNSTWDVVLHENGVYNNGTKHSSRELAMDAAQKIKDRIGGEWIGSVGTTIY